MNYQDSGGKNQNNKRGVQKFFYSVIKTIFDYLLSIICLIVLSPVILILVIVIRFSGKGPIIFRQDRIGKDGKPFLIYKFRSMVFDAEKEEPLLSGTNEERVTVTGRFLRKYRFDEIPNFLNVLKGDMSIVGPRPERRFFIDQIVKTTPQYCELQKVKPGITSWGQVKYGYASNIKEMTERLEYDLYYMKKRSILFDLKILLYTVVTVIKGKGV